MKKLVFFVVPIVVTAFLVAGCESPKANESSTDKSMSSDKAPAGDLKIREPKSTEIGMDATCPVMTNMKFKVSKTTPVIDYNGKTYFFCCAKCAAAFKANPEKYTK